MEFLRHPLYSILAVILIGAVCGVAAYWMRPGLRLLTAILAGMGAAFLGFHFAMLSNLATNVIWMPFAAALVVALLASFALVRA
jgi:uncharacterized membrane protein YeaQ/YmgE (transglycosylase-associated protein family)